MNVVDGHVDLFETVEILRHLTGHLTISRSISFMEDSCDLSKNEVSVFSFYA